MSKQQEPSTNVQSYVIPMNSISSYGEGPWIHASIGGGPALSFMVDTGSEGILVGKKLVGENYTLTDKPFHFGYSSNDGIAYKGYYVITPVVLSSSPHPTAKGAVIARTIPMMVRMVFEYQKGAGTDWLDDCTAAMMGIGFDRGSTGIDSGGHPIPPHLNPFLRLEEMVAGTMVAGYILDLRNKKTFTLGLTEDVVKEFNTIQLSRQDPPPPSGVADWVAPLVQLSIPPNVNLTNVSLLVDTGLGSAIITSPSTTTPQKTGTTVNDGQTVTISYPGFTDHPVLYSFVVHNVELHTVSPQPASVSWLKKEANFVNTSMHALSQFDYMFDDKNGRLGFRF